MTTPKYETRGVLGECYKGRKANLKVLLTHLVFLDEQGNDTKSGCRQNVDHLADHYSDPEKNDLRPTCPKCAAKWDNLQK